MTHLEAEKIALDVLHKQNTRVRNGDVSSCRFNSGDRGDTRSGWVVWVPLLVPDGWEEDHIRVEIFEPDGEVNIPMIL